VLTRIDVTQRHIMYGQRGKCETCPVALAIKEKVLRKVDVEVATYIVELTNRVNKPVIISLTPPVIVSWFVSRFDNGEVMPPFSFSLDIPDDLLAQVPAAKDGA
jgi:hypothetical protein